MAARGITGSLCRLVLRRSLVESRLCRSTVVTGVRYFSRSLRPTTTTAPANVPSQCHSRIVFSKASYSSSHYDKWTDLTYEDLVALLDSGDIQLFDVREPKELEETGKIPRSVNIPLGSIKEALTMEDARFTEHYRVPKPLVRDTNIVFYGMGPVKSTAALEIAHKLGFKKARHFPGGFEEWTSKLKQRK